MNIKIHSLAGLALFCSLAPRADAPRHFHDAVAAAKLLKRPMLVVRVPEKPLDVERLGGLFVFAIDGDVFPVGHGTASAPAPQFTHLYHLDWHELLAEVVVVFLSGNEIRENIKNAVAGENIILAGSDGARISGGVLEPSEMYVLSSGKAFEKLRVLIHGPNGELLKSRADAAWNALSSQAREPFQQFLAAGRADHEFADDLTPEQKAARKLEYHRNRTAALPAEPPGTTGKLPRPAAQLLYHVDAKMSDATERHLLYYLQDALPWIVAQRAAAAEKDPHRQSRARALIETAFENSDAPRAEPLLPFGIVVGKKAVEAAYDPCPPCGMAVVRSTHRDFIQFLSKE